MTTYTSLLSLLPAASCGTASKLLPTLHLPDYSYLLLLVVSATVTLTLFAMLSLAGKVHCWHRLNSSGPAELSAQLLDASADKVVTVQCLHWGKRTFVGRHDVAAQVFKPRSFVNRLGSPHGLKLLGMYKQGIIWNNDTTDWQTKRDYFAKGIQALVVRDASQVKLTTLAAFKLTLAEQCHQAAAAAAAGTSAPTSPHPASYGQMPPVQELAALPLSELAGQVSGLSLDLLPDGRDFLRLVTFRVTAALAFGLPVDTLSKDEALAVVYKVAAFFKAWDYFLLRPAWLCHLTSCTATHRKHLAAVQALQDATTHLIKLATTNNSSMPSAMGKLPAEGSHAPDTSVAAAAVLDRSADNCFLSKLLADQAAGLLSQQAVCQLALEMLLAGTDTSSISLYYLMVQLSGDPSLEQQLLAEVLQAAGDVHALDDAAVAAQLPISAGCDNELPKCQAALCEALRFKPVGPISIRQATEPVTISYSIAAGRIKEQQLQAGDTVIVSLATMHSDPAVFPDPRNFNPAANFAASYPQPNEKAPPCTATASHSKTGHAVSAAVTGNNSSDAFRPFGHGRKGCVGRELGWMEMKVMLACWLLTMRFRRHASKPQPGTAAAAAAAAAAEEEEAAQSSLLGRMQTRWEVAAQPIQPLPLRVRCVQLAGSSRCSSGLRKLYVVGPHGSGKTTLCNALMQELNAASACPDLSADNAHAGPKGDVICEGQPATAVAEKLQLAASVGLEVDGTCRAAAVGAPAVSGQSAQTVHFSLITETARHVMAANGITRQQFMTCGSSDVDPAAAAVRDAAFLRLQQLITAEQLKRERAASAAGQCVVSDRAIIDVLAYATERWGSNSRQVQQLLTLPATQELLSNCRAATSLVLLVPPYDADHGLCGPVDDGVRMTTPTAGLTAAFEAVMQQLGVPYEVVASCGVQERVDEVLQLLGMPAC